MRTEELYKKVIADLPFKVIHPLHKAMMEECCETALNNSENLKDTETLIYGIRLAFITCISMLKGTLQASFKSFDANQVTLNYRNQTFIITYNSPLLNN